MSKSKKEIRLRSAADVVAAVPYLIGFHPADSLVFLAPGEETFVARMDLPSQDRVAEAAALLAALVADKTPESVVLIGYGSADAVTPLMNEAVDIVADFGVELTDALRVAEGRYWSYVCADETCCPRAGKPVPGATAVTAAAEAEGMVALGDREELVASVAPARTEAMAEANRRVELEFMRTVKDDPKAARNGMVTNGLALVRRVVAAALTDDPRLPSDTDIAWLGILLTHLRVRDEAWVRIDPERPEESVRLWRDVLRRVDDAFAAGPACLLAFAAWRAGNGALANVALDRAEAADPGYTMAALLRDIVGSGLPPWTLPPPMTPEELEREWDEQRDDKD